MLTYALGQTNVPTRWNSLLAELKRLEAMDHKLYHVGDYLEVVATFSANTGGAHIVQKCSRGIVREVHRADLEHKDGYYVDVRIDVDGESTGEKSWLSL